VGQCCGTYSASWPRAPVINEFQFDFGNHYFCDRKAEVEKGQQQDEFDVEIMNNDDE
jgi:phage terminase Nu1 subunit (DNA packaging protein)